MSSVSEMKVVIVGGGVIGASVAYHLALRNVASTIIEKSSIACAASGKAGGFLALDWCDHSPVGALARLSFKMHEELAAKLTSDIDYRKLDTYSVRLVQGKKKRSSMKKIDWLDGDIGVARVSQLGDRKTTAQVHPKKLTKAFVDEAERKCGTKVVYGKVTGVKMEGEFVRAVTMKCINDGIENEVACTHLILAMGPWSTECGKWFQELPPVIPEKASSIIVKAKNVGPQALFTSFVDAKCKSSEPEVYPRPDGSVYICGTAKAENLPDDPTAIKPHPTDMKRLKDFAQTINHSMTEENVEAEQACYLPGSPDGLPIIGKVTKNAHICTGHSCWGILNSPATGKAMAELVIDGKSSIVDLDPFSPSRFARRFSRR
eukprot:Plantae.Rhodophyta-Hildenbrandia_rubra.ctg246.p1 GENE.Plantae.Rhodophyta-Hildenbrandia_rubra.ctg246~~Plantae.Rhodophyta-Hildenbrandia_rubra.ctg246.p1  ORF type:complete len:375 (+),score=63.82 Plantae.Rhodophyta-Hildenbrandia_rubra.ctg246:5239-6363(+)